MCCWKDLSWLIICDPTSLVLGGHLWAPATPLPSANSRSSHFVSTHGKLWRNHMYYQAFFFSFFFGTADLWKLEQKRLQSLPDPHFPIFVITGCQYGIYHGWDMCCCGMSPQLSRKRLVCVPAKPLNSCVASINHLHALSFGFLFGKQITISTLSTSQDCCENAFHSFIP